MGTLQKKVGDGFIPCLGAAGDGSPREKQLLPRQSSGPPLGSAGPAVRSQPGLPEN